MSNNTGIKYHRLKSFLLENQESVSIKPNMNGIYLETIRNTIKTPTPLGDLIQKNADLTICREANNGFVVNDSKDEIPGCNIDTKNFVEEPDDVFDEERDRQVEQQAAMLNAHVTAVSPLVVEYCRQDITPSLNNLKEKTNLCKDIFSCNLLFEVNKKEISIDIVQPPTNLISENRNTKATTSSIISKCRDSHTTSKAMVWNNNESISGMIARQQNSCFVQSIQYEKESSVGSKHPNETTKRNRSNIEKINNYSNKIQNTKESRSSNSEYEFTDMHLTDSTSNINGNRKCKRNTPNMKLSTRSKSTSGLEFGDPIKESHDISLRKKTSKSANSTEVNSSLCGMTRMKLRTRAKSIHMCETRNDANENNSTSTNITDSNSVYDMPSMLSKIKRRKSTNVIEANNSQSQSLNLNPRKLRTTRTKSTHMLGTGNSELESLTVNSPKNCSKSAKVNDNNFVCDMSHMISRTMSTKNVLKTTSSENESLTVNPRNINNTLLDVPQSKLKTTRAKSTNVLANSVHESLNINSKSASKSINANDASNIKHNMPQTKLRTTRTKSSNETRNSINKPPTVNSSCSKSTNINDNNSVSNASHIKLRTKAKPNNIKKISSSVVDLPNVNSICNLNKNESTKTDMTTNKYCYMYSCSFCICTVKREAVIRRHYLFKHGIELPRNKPLINLKKFVLQNDSETNNNDKNTKEMYIEDIKEILGVPTDLNAVNARNGKKNSEKNLVKYKIKIENVEEKTGKEPDHFRKLNKKKLSYVKSLLRQIETARQKINDKSIDVLRNNSVLSTNKNVNKESHKARSLRKKGANKTKDITESPQYNQNRIHSEVPWKRLTVQLSRHSENEHRNDIIEEIAQQKFINTEIQYMFKELCLNENNRVNKSKSSVQLSLDEVLKNSPARKCDNSARHFSTCQNTENIRKENVKLNSDNVNIRLGSNRENTETTPKELCDIRKRCPSRNLKRKADNSTTSPSNPKKLKLEKMLICSKPTCSYETNDEKYFERHKLVHRKNTLFCNICEYVTYTQRQLSIHLKTHFNLKKRR